MTRNFLAYHAAISADSIFSAELQRVYGKAAGDKRYQYADHADETVNVARRQFNQAVEALCLLGSPAL
jgi:hypothetical protein